MSDHFPSFLNDWSDFQSDKPSLRHIRDTHVNNKFESQFWHHQFGGPLTSLPLLLAWLKPRVQAALLRPFYIAYQQYDNANRLLHLTREVILQDGVVAVLRCVGGRVWLVTAYCPWAAVLARPQRRWLKAADSRRNEYTVEVSIEGQLVRVAPAAAERFGSADPAGYRKNVELVGPWGFKPRIASDGEVLRVAGPLPPWNPAG